MFKFVGKQSRILSTYEFCTTQYSPSVKIKDGKSCEKSKQGGAALALSAKTIQRD